MLRFATRIPVQVAGDVTLVLENSGHLEEESPIYIK